MQKWIFNSITYAIYFYVFGRIGIKMLLLLFLPFLARMSLGCTTWKKGPCIIPYRVDGTIHTECLNREIF